MSHSVGYLCPADCTVSFSCDAVNSDQSRLNTLARCDITHGFGAAFNELYEQKAKCTSVGAGMKSHKKPMMVTQREQDQQSSQVKREVEAVLRR